MFARYIGGAFHLPLCECRTMRGVSERSAAEQLCAGREGSWQGWDEGGSRSLWLHPFRLETILSTSQQLPLSQALCVFSETILSAFKGVIFIIGGNGHATLGNRFFKKKLILS